MSEIRDFFTVFAFYNTQEKLHIWMQLVPNNQKQSLGQSFYSDDPSSNPAKVSNFYAEFTFEKREN